MILKLQKMIINLQKCTIALTLTLALTTSAHGKECSNAKYSSGEHKQLGNSGFLAACEASNLIDNCAEFRIPREDGRFDYSYGEIVALGDYFSNADRAYNNKIMRPISESLFRCITKQGRVQYEQKTHPEVKYPSCTWQNALAAPDYLKLASTNQEHFAWNNIVAYTKYHEYALDIALQAYLKQDLARLQKALFYNAFADHFLTDSFAAGHVRVPRNQILSWTKKNIFRPFQHFISDAFALLLHDNDGKDSSGREVGIEVKNSRGDHWVTHSDQELNTCKPDSHISIRLPVKSVEHSIRDIFETFKTGLKPTGVLNSLLYVPTPVEKIPLEHFKLTANKAQNIKNIKRLERSLPAPLRWMTSRAALAKMIHALPEIRDQFATQNRQEAEASSLIQLRFPAEYLDAHTN